MPLFFRIKKAVLRHLIETRWQSVMLAIAGYIAISWGLLFICDEQELIAPENFFYWIVVTASTVGYGDLSPATNAGKLIAALFVIPFGLGLFGLAIGRLAAFVSYQWRKGVKGLKAVNVANHILVIGWNESRTLQLLRLLLRENAYDEQPRAVVLCVRDEIDNPMPDLISFVKVTSFSDQIEMTRAALEQAACIIIDIQDDDSTLTTALYCNSRNPQAHTIAYFAEDHLGDLLKAHCPNVECMPSIAVEMMAKSAFDPGSSALHHQLLDVDTGMTQYSMKYGGKITLPVSQLFTFLKQKHEATLIGVLAEGESNIQINPPWTSIVQPGSILFYIADERINGLDWSLHDV